MQGLDCKACVHKDCYNESGNELFTWEEGGEEIELDACPLTYFDPGLLAEILRDYRLLKHGVLPVAGGRLDQTNRYLLIMDLMESVFAKHKAEKAAEAEQTRSHFR